MTNTKKNKRWLSLLVAMMVILSFSLSSVSAAGDRRTFLVRLSNGYASQGSITIQSDYGTVNSAKSGFIYFNCTVRIGSNYILPGATFRYSISSIKEGGKITLTCEPYTGDLVSNNWRKMTGKIHIQGSSNAYILWKMDSFGTGFYFRNY